MAMSADAAPNPIGGTNMAEVANYEQQVYAGVLGKVIGVYLARPVEGWPKQRLVDDWGLIDHYIAADRGFPLVVPDDDITGTFTFIRALEDSGRYADTPPDFFGKTWLNYLIEGKTILWWGGLGVSTEHTAYLRLKHGVPSPRSGSIALNGRVVAEQIGAQIFIDAFGLVAPGEPQLAARLACPAAQVSHDGEAVNAAMVVAAMVSAAFVEKDMEKLLDIGVSVIGADSLIAQLHRDVRSWCRQDGDWQKTYDRIAEKYGYDTYGGGCHVVPNHALMVMAWSYAPDDFRRALAIITTAGWDTDCNAANVGAVMGLVAGLDGISKDYDFRGPFADRMVLPTAEGTRHISDCLQEALHIARIGRRIMGWPELPPPKAGAWHHFSLPGSLHGYMVEPSDESGHVSVSNVIGPSGNRMLEMAFRGLSPERPARVSTPLLASPTDSGYAVMGAPRLYPGQTVTVTGHMEAASGPASLRLFIRRFIREQEKDAAAEADLTYGDPIALNREGLFTATVAAPGDQGFPVRDFGFEIAGQHGAAGRVLIDTVTYGGAPRLRIDGELPRTESGAALGWVADLNVISGRISAGKQPLICYGKNEGRGVLVTGADDWTDYTISARLSIHCADAAGLIARYQGLQRFVALTKTRDALKLVRNFYGETILAQIPCSWEVDELHSVSLTVRGRRVTASLDGKEVLTAEDTDLGHGGAGFLVDSGLAGFRELAIEAGR
jgi:ADP-ribosylglycohydrolase